MHVNPWDVHPHLTEERLQIVGKIISKIRKKTLELHDPESGDGAWSLGCRIYERTINGFQTATEQHTWLRCVRRNLYFLLIVGNVPIRFKKTDFENAAKMNICLYQPEIKAHQFAFEFDESGWFWRIFIETDENHDILRLVLAQITENGNTKNAYNIPISDLVTHATSVKTTLREPATVEKPQLGIKRPKEKEAITNGSQE